MPTARVPARQRQRERQGSITKLPNELGYAVRVTVSKGVRQRLKGGPWATEQEARNALIRWQAQQMDGGQQAQATLKYTLLKDVYDLSLADVKSPLEESRDRRHFHNGVITGSLKPRVGSPGTRMILGDIPVGNITLTMVNDWARSCRQSGMAPSTVAKWGRHLSQCLQWAVNNKYITSNPCNGATIVVRGSITASRKRRYFLTLSEMVKITEAAPEGHRLMFEVLLWSGARQGEVRSLTPDSFSKKTGALLQIEHSVSDNKGIPVLGPPKTEHSIRRVPLPGPLMNKLLDRAAETKPGMPLFPAARGVWMRSDTLVRAWTNTITEAGVTGNPRSLQIGRRKAPTPHDCRASVASMLFASGANVPEVQAHLGHSTPLMTLGLYTELQGFGDQERIYQECKTDGKAVPDILDYCYRQAHLAYGDDT